MKNLMPRRRAAAVPRLGYSMMVNETIWDECWVHSVSDNIPDINEEQDL